MPPQCLDSSEPRQYAFTTQQTRPFSSTHEETRKLELVRVTCHTILHHKPTGGFSCKNYLKKRVAKDDLKVFSERFTRASVALLLVGRPLRWP